MKKKLLLKTMLLLCALVVGSSSVWAAEGDTHDFEQSLSQLLNNSATIEGIDIAAQSYSVKKVVVSYRYNKTIENAVTVAVSVGGTSWGSKNVVGTGSDYTTMEFSGDAVKGAIAISFTNNTGSGTGHGTFYVNNVQLVEGPAEVVAGTTAPPAITGTTPFLGSTTVTISNDESATGADIYYTVNGDDPTTTTSATCFKYSAPFELTATTTVKAIAKHADDDNASEVVSKEFEKITPKANIAALVEGGAADYVTLTDALVTYKNGTTAYLEDASGAIILHQCAGDLAAGDKISGVMNVTNYTVYSNLPEIKAFTLVDGYTKTSGNTVTPTEVTLATLMADDATYNSYLSRYVTIKGATVTSAFSSKNCTIQQGDKTITLRDQNSTATLTSTANDVVTVTAHVAIYGTTKQIAVYAQSQIVVKELEDNAITGIEDSYELDLKADGGISTLDLSAATATSGGAVTFAVTSATQEDTEYELDGAELTVAQKGTIVITASVAADADYKAASKDVTVTVWDAPVLTLDSKTILAGKTYTLAAGTDYDSDGAVTLASEDENIATVNNETKTITAVAAGTTNINVTFAKGTTTLAGSGVIALTVSAPEGQTTMPVDVAFQETFDKNTTNQGGNDGVWDQGSGNTILLDNASGIELSSSAYAASKCVRLGTGSNQGSATITIAANVDDVFTLSFKAAPWNAESSTKADVSVTGGKISGISTSVMTAKQWNDFSGTITATAETVVITIATTGSKRFFLDEILLTKGISTTSVTLAASGYASYCSEYPLDFTTTDGYKAYYVSAATAEAVTFKPITGKIKGGQGIILYGTPSAECTLTYCESDNELADNLLVGTTAPKNIATVEGDYTNFGLSAGKFVKITSGNVPANKAYLPVKTADIATARELAIIFDDATGIDSVTRDALKNGKIYNLQGQEVKNATKGIFIVNGKKVVIK